jgi:hypothetical protein
MRLFRIPKAFFHHGSTESKEWEAFRIFVRIFRSTMLLNFRRSQKFRRYIVYAPSRGLDF